MNEEKGKLTKRTGFCFRVKKGKEPKYFNRLIVSAYFYRLVVSSMITD